MKLVIAMAVYPGVEPYVAACLDSLVRQTDRDFSLVIADAGMSGMNRAVASCDVEMVVVSAFGTPGAVRQAMLAEAVEHGDAVILQDADDEAAPNRVEVLRDRLAEHPLVFNDLFLFGDAYPVPRPMLAGRVVAEERYVLSDIRAYNVLGMTNTAARSEELARVLDLVPTDLVAYDWALFSAVLAQGNGAVFTDWTWTNYRQYAANVTGVDDFTNAQIEKGVGVKAAHYTFLERFDQHAGELRQAYDALCDELAKDRAFATQYFDAVRAQAHEPFPLWWEAMKTKEELGL